MKLTWTYNYCGMQYLKLIDGLEVPRRHHIALRLFDDGLYMASYTDLDKNNHLHMSNFGHDEEFVGTLTDCIFTVEGWVKEIF
jgi:hypothetical protein